jgi:hypothetical protein
MTSLNYKTYYLDVRPAIAKGLLERIDNFENHRVPPHTISMLKKLADNTDEARSWVSLQMNVIEKYVRERTR